MSRRKLPVRRRRGNSQNQGSGRKSKQVSGTVSQGLSTIYNFLLKILGGVSVAILLVVIALLGYYLLFPGIWDGKERITLAVHFTSSETQQGKVLVITHLPEDQILTVVSFPDEMTIKTIGGFGTWRVGSIFPLGELEDNGGVLLQGSLADYLGAEIEGWLYTTDDIPQDKKTFQVFFDRLLTNVFTRKIRTNLPLVDVIQLWRSLHLVPSNLVAMYDLESQGILQQVFQPDGSTLFISDAELMDNFSKDFFSEPRIVEEGMSMVILNSTDHLGLGVQAARLVHNVGGDVIAVRDFSDQLEKTRMVVSNDTAMNTLTVKKLLNLFDIEIAEVGDTAEYRADVVLILGEDYWTSLEEL